MYLVCLEGSAQLWGRLAEHVASASVEAAN